MKRDMTQSYRASKARDSWLVDAEQEIAKLKAQIEAMTPKYNVGKLVSKMPIDHSLTHTSDMITHCVGSDVWIVDDLEHDQAVAASGDLREALETAFGKGE